MLFFHHDNYMQVHLPPALYKKVQQMGLNDGMEAHYTFRMEDTKYVAIVQTVRLPQEDGLPACAELRVATRNQVNGDDTFYQYVYNHREFWLHCFTNAAGEVIRHNRAHFDLDTSQKVAAFTAHEEEILLGYLDGLEPVAPEQVLQP